VNATRDALSGRLNEIRRRIAAAAARSGRTEEAVTLIGVIKTVPVERVREALEAGLRDVGENRVQEAEAAITALGRGSTRWHMIGHLQGNKGGRALELFDRIHTLDSIELAERLSRKAADRSRPIPVLIQVNVSGEGSKSGVDPRALQPLLERALGLPGLAVDGLMSIGAPAERPEDARREFAGLRELRDAAERALGVNLPQLSMGMSDDFEVAVEEGSTMVRVGRALFGARG
jgi:PLP dependent protein